MSTDSPRRSWTPGRREAIEEAKATGKPEAVAQKIAEGKMRKFLEENTLLGQVYLKDPDGKTLVKQLVPAGTRIVQLVRMKVGERTAEEG